MFSLNITNHNYLSSKRGFSLIEVMIVLILMVILIGVSASMYSSFAANNRRQERINLVQRSMDETKTSLENVLTTLPGQGLGTTNGEIFSLPELPFAGSITDETGKTTPIALNIITPYHLTSYDGSINSDAILVVYSDPTLPRFPISENIRVDKNIGKIRIPSPAYVGSGKPITLTNSSNQDQITISKGTTPTPTPTPTSTIKPVPQPSTTPNVAFNTTILEQNWIPSPEMFHVGDTILLISNPGYSADPTTMQSYSRLINITAVSPFIPILGGGGSGYIELTFDFCNFSGDCGTQFPGLTNNQNGKNTIGSIVMPLRLSSFYLKKTKFGNSVIRNDGGVILPNGNSFQIQGGKDTIIGESDDFTVTYHLSDGTTQPTPNTPLVSWLNKITSVDILLSNSVPSGKGSEQISQKITTNFQINVRNLQ